MLAPDYAVVDGLIERTAESKAEAVRSSYRRPGSADR